MIKLTKIEVVGDHELELTFNDGRCGRWSAAGLIARDTVLTRPLEKPTYFNRAFIEAGAHAWPNGLELAPASLIANSPVITKNVKKMKLLNPNDVAA